MRKIYLLPLLLLPLFSCSEKSSSEHVDSGREGYISLYALNDYHGRISYNELQKENGISRVSAFLNEQKEGKELEYVLLNSGDLWQDTYESNSNQGACLTECFEEMNCEAMQLGNHEFDWTIDLIKENRKLTSNCEYLGANIFYYDQQEDKVLEQASDLCSPYKIVERNGYKIGVIGIIGKSQITSITSTNWENLTFVDPLEIVKDYSDELRSEKNCDLIVLLAHADTSALSFNFCNSVTGLSSQTNRPYIDCCFTGHSHILENKEYNSIPFIQGENNGNYVSHIEFDLNSGIPVCTTKEFLEVKTDKTDPKIDSIVNKYITNEFKAKRDEVVATFDGVRSITSAQAGKLQAYATYQKLKDVEELKDYKISAVINNGGRTTVKLPTNGEVTRENLFNITPFTNKTYVAQVTGANLISVLRNNKYYAPETLKLEKASLYYVACIDYILLHKDTQRNYDNFSSYDGNYLYIEEDFPDEIIYSWIKGKTINSSFFDSSNFPTIS